MSEAQTNPQAEVEQPQLSMFDVMFGSEEKNTNPEQAIEEPSEEVEVEAVEEAEEIEAEAEEYEEVEEEELVEEPNDTYTVKVDGEEFEVSLDELRNGYQRQSDYTRKSQALAEQRKAYESNIQSIETERQQYAAALQNMVQNQNNALAQYENINWAELKDSDPVEYMEKRLEYQDAKDKVAALQQEQIQVQQQNEATFKARINERLQEEAKLLAKALPEYNDPNTNLKGQLRDYATGLGFTPQDIDGIIDHRVVMVLHKAMMHDAAISGNPAKKIKTAPRVVKSGTPQTKAQKAKRTVQAKRERLAKTGNTRDAANVFLDLIS
jgi:DNA repair exonuclease SbcCD ATPase subunit